MTGVSNSKFTDIQPQGYEAMGPDLLDEYLLIVQ